MSKLVAVVKKRKTATSTRGQGGVQSVEIAARLLKAMAQLEGPQTLKNIGLASGMSPAKVHRYLASLIREGLVEQNPSDGLYDFGGACREIGHAALERLDIVRIGTSVLLELHRVVGETVLLAVWGNGGVTVIYSLTAQQPVSISVRTGTLFPTLTSAVGKICGAYLPRSLTGESIERERVINQRAGLGPQFHNPAMIDDMLEGVRTDGYSIVRGELMTGIHALGVPVFGPDKSLSAVISAVGAAGSIDIRKAGNLLPKLLAASQTFSERLG